MGKPGLSVTGGIEASFFRSEDSFLFNAQSLEGKSDDISITIGGKVLGITLTKSTAVTQDGVVIDIYGIQFASAGSEESRSGIYCGQRIYHLRYIISILMALGFYYYLQVDKKATIIFCVFN